MRLADAFLQGELHCILGRLEPMALALLASISHTTFVQPVLCKISSCPNANICDCWYHIIIPVLVLACFLTKSVKDTHQYLVSACVCVSYLGNKVLVTGVVCGNYGEDVPVIFLHDVEHDGRLLLDGGPELKEHGAVVLWRDRQGGFHTGWSVVLFVRTDTYSTRHLSLSLSLDHHVSLLQRSAGHR